MKAWKSPEIWQLGIEMTAGNGNEEYTEHTPQAPAQHPDWVWCTQHLRWHPMNHS